MALFRLRQRVRRIGSQEVRTVEEIRENPAAETMYWIQLGTDFATREWANESELERAPDAIGPDREALRPQEPPVE